MIIKFNLSAKQATAITKTQLLVLKGAVKSATKQYKDPAMQRIHLSAIETVLELFDEFELE